MRLYNEAIGTEVKRMRIAAGLNQADLAPAIGLDQPALSRVETGKQMLTMAQWVLFRERIGTHDGISLRIRRKALGLEAVA